MLRREDGKRKECRYFSKKEPIRSRSPWDDHSCTMYLPTSVGDEVAFKDDIVGDVSKYRQVSHASICWVYCLTPSIK